MVDDPSGGPAPETFTLEQVQARIDAEVTGLKNKNSELLGKNRSLLDAHEPFKGLDPEAVQAALKASKDAQAQAAKDAGDWEARESALRSEFAAEHSAAIDPVTLENTQLRTDLFEAVAMRDALEVMATPEIKGNPNFLVPILRNELSVEVIDGKRQTVVKGADGKPRYHQTTNALFTVKDRLMEIRAQDGFGNAFEGAGGSGGGAGPADRGGGSGSGGTVAAGDEAVFLKNLEAIAKGEITVSS